jgi:hypothetical protein
MQGSLGFDVVTEREVFEGSDDRLYFGPRLGEVELAESDEYEPAFEPIVVLQITAPVGYQAPRSHCLIIEPDDLARTLHSLAKEIFSLYQEALCRRGVLSLERATRIAFGKTSCGSFIIEHWKKDPLHEFYFNRALRTAWNWLIEEVAIA